jgi:abequosyltransferase
MNPTDRVERPLLTIAIPTFNRCEFLRQLLNSLGEQTRGDDRVEILVSDNASPDETSAVVEEARRNGMRLNYIRNEKNIGADANFLQCYERAASKYIWIFSDDDLLRPGAVSLILTYLDQDEYDLVYVSSFGFAGEVRLEPIARPPQAFVYTDAARFVRQVHIFTTMISGNIVNKDHVEAVGHEPFARLVDSSLIQLGWTFTALRGYRKGLYIVDELVCYRLGNTGGYGVCQVFGSTLSNVAEEWLGIPILNRLILNASLQRTLPACLLDAKRSQHGNYLREDPHAVLSGLFAANYRYWLFDYPLIVLPSRLGWVWLQMLRLFNRIDRACGYPSLSW